MKRFFIHALACTSLLLHALTSVAAPGAHGPNGEHLDIPAGAAASADERPQFETLSEQLEITGHLYANALPNTRELRLYLNHFDSSAPVLDAATEVEVQAILPTGDISAAAPFVAAHGAYVVTDAALLDALQPAGAYPLMLTVIGPDDSRYGSDLLEATLHVPDTAPQAADAQTNPQANPQADGWLARVPLHVWVTMAVLLALRVLIDTWRWGRRQFAGAQP